MPRLTAVALAVTLSAVTLSAAPALAEPVLGVWQTQPDDGAYAHITMEPCGAAICGTISRTFNASGEFRSENIGKRLVIDMTPAGNGRYNGKVWRPSNDKIYNGKIDLAGDQLKLAGCVAGGLLCSSQTWSRVK